MTKRQRRAGFAAFVVGLVVTGLTVIAFQFDSVKRLEKLTLDFRFCYANAMHDDPSIVCIYITDKSLNEVGRWPWSRDDQAALISIPAELGAKAILVDLTWSEPEPVRVVVTPDFDVVGEPLALTPAEAELSRPDHALAAAIAGAGNVYLNFDFAQRVSLSSDEMQTAVDALLAGDEAGAGAACEHLIARAAAQRAADPRVAVDVEWAEHAMQYARLITAIQRQPLMTGQQAVASGEFGEAALTEQTFEPCRSAAYRRLVRRWIAADPRRAALPPPEVFAALHHEITGERTIGESDILDPLAMAVRHVLGEASTLRPWISDAGRLGSIATRADSLTPVYFRLARVAKRCGFVNFDPDSDGVVRRVPLLARHGAALVPQIALALACDVLGVDTEGIEARNGELILRPADAKLAPRIVQVDRQGRALVPWLPEQDWIRSYPNVSAESIITLARYRRMIRQNEALIRDQLALAIRDPRVAAPADGERLLKDATAAIEEIERSRLAGQNDVAQILEEQLAALRPELERLEQAVLRAAATSTTSQPTGAAETAPALAEIAATIRDAREANRRHAEVVDYYRRQLTAKLDGKLCLIGYAATSLADLKPIPTNKSAPGVLAHANLLNGLITGQLVTSISRSANVAIALLAGALLSAASVLLRPRLSVLVLLLAVTAHVTACMLLMFHARLWVELMPTVAALLLSYFAVAIYRFIFIDGERRQLSTALGQYTSKEIARQVAENAELCRRAEMREVTSVFTDLKGFTTISERIGAERTQKVLNVCLGRFTDVLLRQEAMVNKFIGDGIFAFWNPVIYPQPDHAERACEAAVDLIVALEEMRREQAAARGDEIFGELMMRVGVATGNAIVGPCGSEQKYDYTCIGDSVNTAARLESANKFYGTHILIAGATRERIGDRFEVRPLGGVQVKGKSKAVPVFELLGRKGEVDSSRLRYAAEFGEAVRLFQQRDFDAARRAFESLSRQRPDDLAAHNYLEAAVECAANAPPADWNGAIELKEK